MILRRQSKNRLYLQIDKFRVDEDVDHLFSTRIGWNQKNILEDLSDMFNIEREKIYTASQVHGTEVETIKDQKTQDTVKMNCDGLITDKKGIVLTSYHADCVPLYFYDRVKKVIGIAHSGWKGSLNNISKTMVYKFKNEFLSNSDDIIVGIGPSIGPCCYEIGSDVELLFKEKFPSEKHIIIYKHKKMYLDLWKINKINLLASGIKDENIIESLFCTACNIDTLYSYRKEHTKDRMIGAITLKV